VDSAIPVKFSNRKGDIFGVDDKMFDLPANQSGTSKIGEERKCNTWNTEFKGTVSRD
jgi:hypothetical protein